MRRIEVENWGSGEGERVREPIMKLRSKSVWERFVTAIKIDRIPLFDVSRHGVISFIDQTGRSAASG